MSIIQKLTEGVINRDLSRESDALLTKWEKTGLLEGLSGGNQRQNMASLLENQAKELLREASTMHGGDVEGFAAVAFPIVRRVFGGLVANDLVSVQAMSLPSGLIFFLDFTSTNTRLGSTAGESLYGGGRVGQQITGGVDLAGASADKSFYNLNNGYSSPTGSATITPVIVKAGVVGSGTGDDLNSELSKLVNFDPDLSGSTVAVATINMSDLDQFNKTNLVTFTPTLRSGRAVRRQTKLSGSSLDAIYIVAEATGSQTLRSISGSLASASVGTFVITDDFQQGQGLGSVVGDPLWGLEAGDEGQNTDDIPEIDIKVDSVSVTAITKKLRAKWTPELQQDINAYHNLDAEVELTSILSETIALEIDQEILEDLVKDAKAGTFYWSRRPGKFVNKTTGAQVSQSGGAPDFTGTVSEWNETLLETVNDVSAQIHRKTLRGGANFLVCGPETANVMEMTNGFRATTTADENRGDVGAVKTGTISKKFDVYVDPYFPRNVILVGRKGASFLESGYVYAPYVPLQTTPTIFDPETFAPRKGVMTRYAKKMVRPDMYGLVVIQDFLG